MWVIEMRETFEQARPARARHRKRWEIVAREEIHFQNFVVGVWSAARNFAEEDHLEGVMGGQRLASRPIAIKYADHLPCHGFKTRFFVYLSLGCIRWHVTDVGPTAGQAPRTVRFFAHQQDLAVAKAGPRARRPSALRSPVESRTTVRWSSRSGLCERRKSRPLRCATADSVPCRTDSRHKSARFAPEPEACAPT